MDRNVLRRRRWEDKKRALDLLGAEYERKYWEEHRQTEFLKKVVAKFKSLTISFLP